jgi:tRNA-2-methylthio-N6-dimethylallyladenosine synthase
MNKLDSELVESRLREVGYHAAASEDEANVVLLNTCSVRQHAEDRVWSRLGRLRVRKRRDPSLVVGVLGCMAQEHKLALQARMPHVDLVVGPSAFGDIEVKVEEARRRNRLQVGAGILAVDRGASGDGIRRDVRVRPHRSQAFISVMRGCNMPCTYCIVPTTRGPEISRTLDTIAEEARRLADDGVTEITLLGQTVNAYGRDQNPKANLAQLLRRLHEIPSLRRIAFITSHPNFLTEDLIQALAELPRLASYLHLPVQSGSNRILKAMQRGYTAERYLERIERLVERAPHIELQSDFIVGFPTESAEDFQATVDLMERLRFAQSYVFKYSPRPGTVSAAEQLDDVPESEKQRRNQILLQLQETHTLEHNRRQVGELQEVLVEGRSPKVASRMTGRTAAHRIAHFDGDDPSLVGRYVWVKITRALPHSLVGELQRDHVEAAS